MDTNIFISWLLTPNNSGPILQIIEAWYSNKFTLLVPTELIEELVRTLLTTDYLRKRVMVEDLETIISLLAQQTEPVTPILEEIPPLSRDPKDDYLRAYALVGKADYLVTGDEDLLTFKQIDKVKIVSPREFVDVLDQSKK